MKKSFGQHLLTDKNYLNKIIKNLALEKNDVVIEIGAGSGLLTNELSRLVEKVYAVELEKNIIKKLHENIKLNNLKNVEVINKDFLELDLIETAGELFSVVGNIPYNITSQILLKLLGEIDKPAEHLKHTRQIYLMMQLEVAQRLVAKLGTKAYSPLSLLIQFFTNPKIIFKIPKGAFVPAPKVESAFVVFEPKKTLPKCKDYLLLKNVIRTGFQQRRKKLINALEKLFEDKQIIRQVFDKLGFSHNLRAENLSLSDYCLLVDNL